MPLVSIGLPVYNGGKYLYEAIESVLAQTFKDFELIISDNASTDETAIICSKFRKKDRRILYYRNDKNIGAAKNFNQVFKLSSGKYFKWIAADTTIEPIFIKKCINLLEKDNSIILACTRFICRYENNNTANFLNRNLEVRSHKAYDRLRAILDRIITSQLPIWGLVRSSVLRQTRLIMPFIGSDSCLLVELGLIGNFGQVKEYLSTVRRHNDSYSDIRKKNDGVEGSVEAKWFDPENKSKVFFPHWKRLLEFARIIINSQENSTEKMKMLVLLTSHLFFKWKKILLKEIFYAFGLKKIWTTSKNLVRIGFKTS
jgi:glycosyltransferase involved in cell wall biosynthesis